MNCTLFGGGYTAAGISLDGDIEIGAPFSKNTKISELLIDSKGNIRKATVTGFGLKLFGGEFKVSTASFEDSDGEVRLSLEDVSVKLKFIDEITIKRMLIINTNGSYRLEVTKANVPINKEFNFVGFKVVISSLVIDRSFGKQYIKVLGGIDFKIPSVEVRVGDFTFYEDGKFEIGEIGLAVDFGVIKARGSLKFGRGKLEGEGSIEVIGVFTAGLKFKFYQGNWALSFKLGVPIPLAGPIPVYLKSVTGGLESFDGALVVSFGCEISVAELVVGEVIVTIDISTGDLEIAGSARSIMPPVNLEEFNLLISIREMRIEGYAKLNYSVSGVKLLGQVNLVFKKEYWGIGAEVFVDAFNGLITGMGGIMFGHRYPIKKYRYVGTTVRSPDKISGFMGYVSFNYGKTFGGIMDIRFLGEFFICMGKCGNASVMGAYYSSSHVSVDLVIVTASLDVVFDIGGQIGKNSS